MDAKKLLLLVVLAAFFVRLLGANQVVYTDEAHYTNIDAYFNSKYYVTYGPHPMADAISVPYFASLGAFPAIAHHPPLSMTLFMLSNLIFKGAFEFRIIPIVFGTLSIILIYLLAELVYGKRTALIAAVLSAFSFYHILASIQLDQHGATHFFFFVAAIYAFLRWEQNKGKKWFILSAVSAGFAMLNVYSAVFLFIALGFYYLNSNVNLKKGFDSNVKGFIETIKTMSLFSLLSFCVYLIFPLFAFFYNKDILVRTFLVGGFFQPAINFRYPVFLFIWLGPLLLGLVLLSLRSFTKKDLIFWLWIGVGATPLMFTDANTSIDRYLMFAIPAFIILAARFLAEIEVKKRQHLIGIASFAIFYALLMFLNLYNVQYVGHVLSNYISMAAHLEWNFFFPITGPSGPAFGITFSSIAVSLLVSFFLIFLIIAFMFLKKDWKLLLSVFLGISFAFNIVLAQEMLISVVHPNYSGTNYELIKYYKQHTLPQAIYTNNRALFYYLNKTGENLYAFTETSPEKTKALLEQGNITVIVFDFPKIPEDNQLWQSIKACKLEKTAYSKGTPYGYIYVC